MYRPEVFCKKSVLRNSQNILRTPILTEHFRWLLLFFPAQFQRCLTF